MAFALRINKAVQDLGEKNSIKEVASAKTFRWEQILHSWELGRKGVLLDFCERVGGWNTGQITVVL